MNPVQAFLDQFPDEASATRFLENIRWPLGPVCPKCGSTTTPKALPPQARRNPIHTSYNCPPCDFQFNVKTGTPMAAGKLSLRIWLAAWYITSATRKPVSVPKLSRALGVSYPTAWRLARRIIDDLDQVEEGCF